jgi:hypothetical protein
MFARWGFFFAALPTFHAESRAAEAPKPPPPPMLVAVSADGTAAERRAAHELAGYAAKLMGKTTPLPGQVVEAEPPIWNRLRPN